MKGIFFNDGEERNLFSNQYTVKFNFGNKPRGFYFSKALF